MCFCVSEVLTRVFSCFQAYSGLSDTFSQLRVIFSFYASTIVPALDAVGKVSDAIIAKLLPYIQMVPDLSLDQIQL